MQYTLAVVGKGLFGKKELLSKKVTIKHPVEYATAEFLEYGGMEEGVFYHMLIRSTVPLKLVITDGTSRWEQPLVIEPDDGFWDEASAPPDSPYSGIAAGELLFPIDLNSSYTMMVVGDGLFQEHIVHAEPLPLFLP